MSFGPTTREEAERQIYACWTGNPEGRAYDPSQCAQQVYLDGIGGGGWVPYQCRRKPGYGPDALYCKRHAERFVSGAAARCGGL